MTTRDQQDLTDPTAPPLTVHQAILAVSQQVGAIGKDRTAPHDIGGFKFRGIEDALNALHPALIAHGLTIIPRVVQYDVEPQGKRRLVTAHVEYDFTGPNGSTIVVGPIIGEGADGQDKAAGKALSGAWKIMAFEVFCIPVADSSIDSEAYNPADDREPTVEELWQNAGTKYQTDGDTQQERLDQLPPDIAAKVTERIQSRVPTGGPTNVHNIRDLGPKWLDQWTSVLDKAWEAVDKDGAA